MKIIAEPGSFIAVNSLSYIANTLYKPKKEKKKLVYYSLDDGIHGKLAFCALFNKTIECIPLNPRGISKIHVL
jgi:diaminopimelate decarboxylase